jgi:hypothetical protein
MIAFIVEDVVGAHITITAAGTDLLGDVIWVYNGFGWFFLRAPDGNIYCIEQTLE